MWTKRWGYELAAGPVRPGIYRLKDGGFLLRLQAGGKQATRVCRDVTTVAEAQRERDRMRSTPQTPPPSLTRFGEYAASLLETKVALRRIKSPATRQWWRDVLEHWLLPAFGAVPIETFHRRMVEEWLTRAPSGGGLSIAERVSAKELSPRTVNNAIRVLLVILRQANIDLELDRDITRGIELLSTSGRPTHTPEDPNTLTAEQAGLFLDVIRARYPQHLAMTMLGFVTGLRCCSLRALRRTGPESDVLWSEGSIWDRRSQTVGDEVVETNKQDRPGKIFLPISVMQTLESHVECLTSRQRESALLFPSLTGGFRSRTALTKPFASASKSIGLKFILSPHGMRRTFNDLARTAGIHDAVTRSISGHQTEEMQLHYSTARADEQRDGIAQVINLVERRAVTR